jgi:iron complex transport system substrate-binding protein
MQVRQRRTGIQTGIVTMPSSKRSKPAPKGLHRPRAAVRTAACAIVAAAALCGAALADAGVQFKDQQGRDITLEKPAERVVTIPIPAASTFIAIDGATDRLVGMHERSKSAIMDGILGTIFPKAKDIPSNVVGKGFAPNVEAILAVRPDLVFQWANLGDEVVKPMTNAGLTVATFNYGTEELSQGWISIMGTVLGRPEKAKALNDWHNAERAALEKAMAGLPEGKKPKVLFFLRVLSELRVAGDGTYNDFYIGLAGGRNAAKEVKKFKVVNAEQVVAWNPDVILLTAHEHKSRPEDVYSNPVFAGLSAVKNKRVYKVPLGGYRWDPPSQESPLMWKWLTKVVHPGMLKDDLRAEMKAKYRFIYGHDLTDDEIDAILLLDINKAQANYAQFTRK